MIVSESYLHFESSALNRSREEIGYMVLPVVEQAGTEFFAEFDAELRGEVVIEEGTIRVKGLLRMGVKALIAYGAIRAGIDYARHDGVAAARWVNQHVEHILHLDRREIIARRSRAPAPRQLQQLFRNVETGVMSANEATERAVTILEKYGEDEKAIRQVVKPLQRELTSVKQPSRSRPKEQLQRTTERRRELPLIPRAPHIAAPVRRLRFIRDSNGQIRILEEF